MAPLSRAMMRLAAKAGAATRQQAAETARQRAGAAATARQRAAPRMVGHRADTSPLTEAEVEDIVSSMLKAPGQGFSSAGELFKGLIGWSTSAAAFMLVFAYKYIDKCADCAHQRTIVYLLERELMMKQKGEARWINCCDETPLKDGALPRHDIKEVAVPANQEATARSEAT